MPAETPVVYDTGALLAGERRDLLAWAYRDESLRAGVPPVVPVVVLAQAWRGGPQPNLSRFLKGCQIVPDSQAMGRAAGAACARAGTSDVVDAIVVMTALHAGAVVMTSDPEDLRRIAAAVDVELSTITV